MTYQERLGIYLVVLELTDRCNLQCLHCYGDGQGNDIKDEDLEIVTRELYRVKPHYITLSGGEPLLLGEKLFQIAVKMKGLCNRLFLTTNGLLTRRYPSESFSIFDDVQISLDGSRDVHQRIRGAGSFEEAIEASKYLSDAGIHVSINMTLNSLNKSCLEEVYEIAKDLKVQFAAGRMSSVGRGGSLERLSSNEWRDLLKTLVKQGTSCDDPLRFYYKKDIKDRLNPHRLTGGCTAGIASLAITSNIDLLPCVRLRLPAGNLREKSLEDIWLGSKIFLQLRHRSSFKGRCGLCYYRNICGGCRADAYAVSGDYLESDPLCWVSGAEVIEDASDL